MEKERQQATEDPLADLTRRVEALETILRERSVEDAQLKGMGSSPPSAGVYPEDPLQSMAASQPADSGLETSPAESTEGSLLPLVGRTLLVLGGAFFLRAATDSGALPRMAGAVLGLLYGMIFLVLAYRAAARAGFYRSAQFHSLSTALIVFPLLFEATVRFGYLSAPLSAIALTLATGSALWVAWRRRLHGAAWLFAGIGAPLSLALALATHLWVPFLGLALVIFWCTLLLSYECKWTFLGLSGAILADMMVLLLTSLFLLQGSKAPLEGLSVSILIALQVALVGSYLGTFSLRILLRAREIQALEAAQTVAVLVVGMGGALILARSHPALMMILGLVSLAAAALSYGISFAFIDRRRGRGRNFMFYTSIALALMLVATLTLLQDSSRTWVLLALAVFTAVLAARKQRATLLLHATVFTVTAAISSGLLSTATGGLLGWEIALESRLLLPFAAVLMVTALCSILRVDSPQNAGTPLVSAPRALCLSLFMFGCCGLAVVLATGVFAASRPGMLDPGIVASMRTSLLSLVAVIMAWIALRPRFLEARWLVYPTLVLAGLELLLGDFRSGRPATMFVSLVIYGGALILAPRLLRQGRRVVQIPESDRVSA